MANCAVVIINETGERGCIIRRMNAQSYEIWLDSGDVVVLSPNDFKEIEGD
jgi:translation initiation factor IF-1